MVIETDELSARSSCPGHRVGVIVAGSWRRGRRLCSDECDGEVEQHGQTPSGCVVEDDGAAHGLHEAPCDCQPEARPGLAVLIAEVLEGLEDALTVGTIDTRAAGRSPAGAPGRRGVPHRPAPGGRGATTPGSWSRCGPERARGARGRCRPRAASPGRRLQSIRGSELDGGERGRHHVFQVGGPEAGPESASLDAAHVQQVADEEVEAIGGRIDGLCERADLLAVPRPRPTGGGCWPTP